MELTNEQRMYLGLEPVEPAWERVEIPNNSVNLKALASGGQGGAAYGTDQ